VTTTPSGDTRRADPWPCFSYLAFIISMRTTAGDARSTSAAESRANRDVQTVYGGATGFGGAHQLRRHRFRRRRLGDHGASTTGFGVATGTGGVRPIQHN
jgi:hypothetical protein